MSVRGGIPAEGTKGSFSLQAAWGGLILSALLAMAPGSALPQQTAVLPPPQPLAPDSTVDVRNLPATEGRERLGPARPELKRRRLRDPEGLRQWKELLELAPEALPPRPGYVGDIPSRQEPGRR